jgi:hypothetical protein
MPFSLTTIIEPQYVPSSQTTLFTAGTGTFVRIDSLSILNTDTVAVTVSINLVPAVRRGRVT